jgi:hypothetical protein
MTIKIRPRTTVIFLGAIVGFLLLADLVTLVSRYYFGHDHVFGLVHLFDLDEEQNAPTYFSTFLMLLSSCLSFLIGAAERNRRGGDYRYWIGLGLICLFISFDELCAVHELIVNPLVRPYPGATAPQQPFYVSWMIPYSIVVIVVGFLYVRFLLRLPARIRHLVLASGFLFVAGAMVAELFVGYHLEYDTNWSKDLIYRLIVACAETLEMLGSLVLVYALMSYIDRNLENLALRITSSPSD